MGKSSLTERDPAFNQSSSADADFQHSEAVSKLKMAQSLLLRVKALLAMAQLQGLHNCTPLESQCYLEAIEEMAKAALG